MAEEIVKDENIKEETIKNEKVKSNKSKFSAKNIAFIGVCAALMAICSWISIPTAVPFTLQTFAVFLAIGLLGGRDGTLSVVVYVLLGAAGVPVFAGFSGGMGIILGNTGGYIVGFIASALIMWLLEKLFGHKIVVLAIGMVLGLVACYAIGTVWFIQVYTEANGAVALGTVLGWCVTPFIIPDLIKIAVALVISARLRKVIINL